MGSDRCPISISLDGYAGEKLLVVAGPPGVEPIRVVASSTVTRLNFRGIYP